MQMGTCFAIDCYERIPAARLMCPRHWLSVPHYMRTRVWRAYQPGQEVTGTVSHEYVETARAAINYVAKLEMKPEITSTEVMIKEFNQMFDRELQR